MHQEEIIERAEVLYQKKIQNELDDNGFAIPEEVWVESLLEAEQEFLEEHET